MLLVPAAIPVTVPAEGSIVPTDRLLLVQVPPLVASLRVTEPAGQIAELFVIEEGVVLTVTTAVMIHVLVPVYLTVAVPALTPYTRPDGLTVAVPVGLMLQVPPVVASDRKLAPVVQTPNVPKIEVGRAFTVTLYVVEQPVGSV